MKYQIVKTTQKHIDELATTMRQVDIDEVWASNHLSPKASLSGSYSMTPDTYTGLVDNQVMCIFGVAKPSFMSDTGIPWLLGSDLITKHVRRFLVANRKVVDVMKQDVKILKNYVDARNLTTIKWLKWLGFVIHPAHPYGVEQLPFHLFTWEQENV